LFPTLQMIQAINVKLALEVIEASYKKKAAMAAAPRTAPEPATEAAPPVAIGAVGWAEVMVALLAEVAWTCPSEIWETTGAVGPWICPSEI